MKKALISIITITYNQDDYIRQCIKSVIDQTYKNWEMIVVDDGSRDNMTKIIKEFCKKDKRINVIWHKKNWGMKKIVDSYNQALNKSRGKYIAILEGDDQWPKDKLKKQLKLHKNCVLSYGNCQIVNQDGYPIDLYLNLYPRHPTYYTPTIMINKCILNVIGGFKKSKKYPFWDTPTISALKTMGQVKYINEILGIYRKHPKSNWLQYSYSQNTSKIVLFTRKLYYWFVFNLPHVFIGRFYIKNTIHKMKNILYLNHARQS